MFKSLIICIITSGQVKVVRIFTFYQSPDSKKTCRYLETWKLSPTLRVIRNTGQANSKKEQAKRVLYTLYQEDFEVFIASLRP